MRGQFADSRRVLPRLADLAGEYLQDEHGGAHLGRELAFLDELFPYGAHDQPVGGD